MARRGSARAGGLPGLAVALALAVGGCASVPKAVPAAADFGNEAMRAADAAAPPLSGRLVLRIDGQPERDLNARFDLHGDARIGWLDLSTPLGSVIARAQWAPGAVALTTTHDGLRRYDSLDDLSREVLGETVPLVALHDWLRGRPWPGADAVARPDASGFEQLGWAVDTARKTVGALSARRLAAPVVSVRAQLDR